MLGPSSLKVLIAADHAGFELKEALKKQLPEIDWIDLGPESSDRVDYPDYADKLGQRIASKEAPFGVLICGSGIGMCIAANRIPDVRAALVENTVAARLSREHNDANVLCLGARFLKPELATEIIQTFLETPFSNDERHRRRVDKLGRSTAGSDEGKE